MKRISTETLHRHSSKLVREVCEGAVLVIEENGRPVAELHPVPKPSVPKSPLTPEAKAKIFSDMQKFWGRFPQVEVSTPLISEDRDRY